MCSPLAGSTRPGDHFALVYEHDDQLATVAAQFCSDGLGAGDAVLVVATGAHRLAIRANLVAAHQGLARVGELEAAFTLDRITDADGRVERQRFFDVFEPALTTVAQSGESGRVRIVGEMVALLTADGDPDDAIALEELWNELADASVPFSLLCGYPQSQIDAGEGFFERVHQMHTAVIDAS